MRIWYILGMRKYKLYKLILFYIRMFLLSMSIINAKNSIPKFQVINPNTNPNVVGSNPTPVVLTLNIPKLCFSRGHEGT